MHKLNPFHKMNKLKTDKMNASTKIFSTTHKGSIYTVAGSKVHSLMLKEIEVAIRFGCPGSPSFVIQKKHFLLPVISDSPFCYNRQPLDFQQACPVLNQE